MGYPMGRSLHVHQVSSPWYTHVRICYRIVIRMFIISGGGKLYLLCTFLRRKLRNCSLPSAWMFFSFIDTISWTMHARSFPYLLLAPSGRTGSPLGISTSWTSIFLVGSEFGCLTRLAAPSASVVSPCSPPSVVLTSELRGLL